MLHTALPARGSALLISHAAYGGRPAAGSSRAACVAVRAASDDNYKNSKSKFSSLKRKRPAHLRSPSPYDTPLRDGNRDRLIGYLTERASKTLLCYLMETNLNLYHWLMEYMKEHPIPKNGNWDDVSGDTFLRTLLSMPVQSAKYMNREVLYDNVSGCGVDPRSMAQRIMEIRAQLSTEFIQDLGQVREDNAVLFRETLTASLNSMFATLPSDDEEPAPSKDSKKKL